MVPFSGLYNETKVSSLISLRGEWGFLVTHCEKNILVTPGVLNIVTPEANRRAIVLSEPENGDNGSLGL